MPKHIDITEQSLRDAHPRLPASRRSRHGRMPDGGDQDAAHAWPLRRRVRASAKGAIRSGTSLTATSVPGAGPFATSTVHVGDMATAARVAVELE